MRWTTFNTGHPPDSVVPEPGLSNWVIYLDQNHNDRRDPGERFTTTDSNGNYAFGDLAGQLPRGRGASARLGPDGTRLKARDLTIAGGEVVTGMDFGNQATADQTNHPPAIPGTAPLTADRRPAPTLLRRGDRPRRRPPDL